MNDTLPLSARTTGAQPTDTRPSDPDEPRPVRPQTIVWGFILFAIAAVVFVWTQLDLNRYNPVVVITWIVLVIGALALLGGILGAVLRKLRR